MDLPDVCVGNTIYLPVYVDGALLHLGDVHAIQGAGEITGNGVEGPSECSLTIDLFKRRKSSMPRIESAEHIMAVACSGIVEAFRTSYAWPTSSWSSGWRRTSASTALKPSSSAGRWIASALAISGLWQPNSRKST